MELYEVGVPRKRLAGQLGFFLLWVVATAVGAWLRPSPAGHGTHQELGLPPCPSVLLFDRPCPGCGLTTSWTNFIHGNFAASFHNHALGPALYILFTLAAFAGLYGWARGGRIRSEAPRLNRGMVAFTFVFVAYGGIRMAVTPHFGTQSEHLFARFQPGR